MRPKASKNLAVVAKVGAISLAALLAACGGGTDVAQTKRPVMLSQAQAPTSRANDMYQFFAVAFGAAPGVTYMGQLMEAVNFGLTTKQVVNIFTTKSQFTDTYPLMLSNTDFAVKLVDNVVGQSASAANKQAAVADIVSALDIPGWTRGDVIFAIFNNLGNKPPTDPDWGGTSQKMKNQVVYAKYYTEVMKGDTTDLPTLRSVVANVDEKSDTANGLQVAIEQWVAANAPPSSCYTVNVANLVGADDPLFPNSWHLKNTGPTQLVSAVKNDGLAGIDANVEGVHKAGFGCTGKGVTVAIVDSALEIGHEDLVANVLAGKSFNFANNSADPSPSLQQAKLDHGTGVAGVAVARGWNDKGSRGTGPFASVVGYPTVGITPDPNTSPNSIAFLAFGAKALADATEAVVGLFGSRADGVGIFNFSAGSDYAAPPTVDDLGSNNLASKWGTSNLRAGRGAVYFQAAGNEFTSMEGVLPDGQSLKVECFDELTKDKDILGGVVSNPTGLTCGSPNHEPSNKPYFYQVASVHNTGKASSYSSSGAANWITGFGGEYGTSEAAIVTTDDSGCASGGNNLANKAGLLESLGEALSKLVADMFGDPASKDPGCNYTGTMNGTSAATPSVAGVTALLLEANPLLTWQDVGYILAKTARKVDTTIASGANAVTFAPTGGNAVWTLDEPWITNAAGFNFHNRYGFGLIDAEAAVKMAVAYKAPAGRRVAELISVGSDSATSRVDNVVGVNTSNTTFPNGGLTGQIRIDLTVSNSTGKDVNPGMLQVVLENTTTGTKSIVLPAFTAWYVGGKNFPIKAGGEQQFRLHTNAFYGESLAGNFKVTVVDFSGSSGFTDKGLSFKPTLTSFSM